jgi:putative transposase
VRYSSTLRRYQVEVSPALISSVTDELIDEVIDEVKAWQNRQLDACYPIVYLDALQFKVRDGGHVRNKAIYVAIGVGLDGLKEVLVCGSPRQRGPSSGSLWLRS